MDRHRIPLNDRVQLSLHIFGTQGVPAPELDLEGFLVQYLGPSTRIAVVSGQVSSTVTHTYLLTPQQEGVLTISPITMRIGGQAFTTAPIMIEVLPPSSQPAGPITGQPDDAGDRSLRDAIQLQVAVDKTRFYLSETIPARLQLLVRGVALRGIEMPVLEAEGFLVRPIQQPSQSEVVIAGEPHTLLEFNTEVTPIRAGALSLGPASIDCQVVVRRRPARRRSAPFGHDPFEGLFGGDSLFDEFFGSGQLQPLRLTAEPVMVEVLPLPEAGRPADFTGAVGRFTLETEVVPTEVAVGEPVTVTMVVRGQGSFETVASPVLSGDTHSFKVYDPQQQEATEGDQTRRKAFDQVLIPLDPSAREVPAVRFNYFDPETGRYETLTKAPVPLLVRPAPAEERLAIIERPGSAETPTPPEAVGRDIVYIKEAPGSLRAIDNRWYAFPWWLWAFVCPAAMLSVSEWLRRRRRRLEADPGLARSSGALRRALASLRRARPPQHGGKAAACYAGIFRALQRYIGDRFNVPSEGLTKTEVERCLRPRGAPEELLRDLCELFDRCDAGRFAPASVALDQLQATLQDAESALKRLERWRPS